MMMVGHIYKDLKLIEPSQFAPVQQFGSQERHASVRAIYQYQWLHPSQIR